MVAGLELKFGRLLRVQKSGAKKQDNGDEFTMVHRSVVSFTESRRWCEVRICHDFQSDWNKTLLNGWLFITDGVFYTDNTGERGFREWRPTIGTSHRLRLSGTVDGLPSRVPL